MAREKKEEPVVVESAHIDMDETKRLFNEMKKDPMVKSALVPVPDISKLFLINIYYTKQLLEEMKKLNRNAKNDPR